MIFLNTTPKLLEGVYDCVDRIVLNAFFPMGQTGGGMRCLWRQALAPGHAFDPLVAVQGSAAHRTGAAHTDRHMPPVAIDDVKIVSALTAIKDGNCFVEGSDFTAVNRLAARLHHDETIGRLRELCERWIYSTCLCFALTQEEQKRIAFAYQYSVFQLELSRNLLFLRRTTMNEVYQKLIDRTRAPLDLKQVKTIFGFSHRPHKIAKRGRQSVQVVKAVEAPSYDLTVFKVK